MKWNSLYLLTLCFSTTRALSCEGVISNCWNQDPTAWTRCYEDAITTCVRRSRSGFFFRNEVNLSEQAEVNLGLGYRVQVPSSALQRSRRVQSDYTVMIVATLINSSYFQPTSPRSKVRRLINQQPLSMQQTVLGDRVLFVKAGSQPLSNLTERVQLIFNNEKMVKNGRCVFWREPHLMNETAQWSTEGCITDTSREEYICSCNHLSFFAVLVNPELNSKVDERNAASLSYITYIGSALSALFAFGSLFIYVVLQ
ncbi:hypothetical protein CRENBAI_019347 [Crenichthys baileyi]|uniref:GAIN-B domain-containing protein n=1 Tax=Crenichthys baileyi TaxID=28760 RepID=A0AAV9SP87_9TELE